MSEHKQTRVLAYARFSSARQAKGTSLERQVRNAQKWCQERGFVLDDLTLQDTGISAWTGANKRRGKLGLLLDLIEAGKVEAGTYLLVEAFDRLTREELTDAVGLITKLLEAGLIIVTLTDGIEWTKESMNSQKMDFMMSVLLLSRGHEESLMKAKRLRETFGSAREKGSRKEFGSAPGWLWRPESTEPWQVVDKHAEAVVKVFELAAAGYGSKAICKTANAEGWPIPTRETEKKPKKWHPTMPGRLLRMRAVLGEHEYRIMTHEAKKEVNHWRGKSSGIVIPDFYPRIISDELWHRARASIATRATTSRRRDEHYFNIWSGLLRCGYCGAMVHRKNESRGNSKAQLICSNKIAGLTECKTGAASATDASLLTTISALAGAEMGLGYDKDELVKKIDVAKSKISDISSSASALAKAIVATSGELPELIVEAERLRKEKELLLNEIEEGEQKLASEPNSLFDDSYANEVLAQLYIKTELAKEARATCNVRVSRVVSAIWHFAYDLAIVEFKSGSVTAVALNPKTKNGERPLLQRVHNESLNLMDLVSKFMSVK
ncbi:recombinase family protein [Massilia agri]|uniref:Recombinase family protein n=1 Tax=Massilia agri TaxID=1886785 RepID=A0ABT2AGP7_9BURK|nr:recombinase family protein [Massilia agri]MCS0595200.1 recombinase family protein [Massilia agri]